MNTAPTTSRHEFGGQFFTFRRLQSGDFNRGYGELLSQLTTIGDLNEEKFEARVALINRCPNHVIQVLVDEDNDQVIASVSVIVEYKFIHGAKNVGHLEDIVVGEKYRKLGLGKWLVSQAVQVAKDNECYKIILDCAPKTKPFYEKNGFVEKGFEMAKYFTESHNHKL